ncbi:MAG: hypothetical protein ABIA04_06295 [Pseudomonadota bacterium]
MKRFLLCIVIFSIFAFPNFIMAQEPGEQDLILPHKDSQGVIKKESASLEEEVDIPVYKNIFDYVEKLLFLFCPINVGIGSVEFGCKKLVKDVMEVASPFCPLKSNPSKIAAGCTMTVNFIINELINNSNEYLPALKRLDAIIADVLGTEEEIMIESVFDLIMDATENNLALAIFISSIPNASHGGLGQIISQLEIASANSEMIEILKKWDGTDYLAGILSQRFPNIRNVPVQHIEKVSQQKEYHYWPRALLSSQLMLRDHSKPVSRYMATTSSVVYEIVFDFFEHVGEEMRDEDNESSIQELKKIIVAAIADIALSDNGSRLGVGNLD